MPIITHYYFTPFKNFFAVQPYGYFNLIVRETLWKILGDCIKWKSYQIVIFWKCHFDIASAFLLNLSSTVSGGTFFKTPAGM